MLDALKPINGFGVSRTPIPHSMPVISKRFHSRNHIALQPQAETRCDPGLHTAPRASAHPQRKVFYVDVTEIKQGQFMRVAISFDLGPAERNENGSQTEWLLTIRWCARFVDQRSLHIDFSKRKKVNVFILLQ
ncbi:hypothetical protein [Azospirillum canadense]|uniref:hypothetical protein n=1 Tax=Azospirillum canadense TaxID=403962 RepID=UPI0022274EFE|nr:hypothetical protein [Azospirillum canadense]MCW2240944.1 hypothetical protein [Azospirillum canadense]